MSRFRNQRGQALILMLLFLGVMMALAAAVLDVGAWYRADRKLQATADAAALAGAHGLPDHQAEAMGLALEYGDKNEGGVASSGVSFETTVQPGDTIRVHAEKPVPGFFSRVSSKGIAVRGVILSSALATILIAANYSRTLGGLFAFMALLSTAAALVLYLACALAACSDAATTAAFASESSTPAGAPG